MEEYVPLNVNYIIKSFIYFYLYLYLENIFYSIYMYK